LKGDDILLVGRYEYKLEINGRLKQVQNIELELKKKSMMYN
jgi:hypothetical protein